MNGYKKVGHKTRRGRNKRRPVAHKQHRHANVIKDPIKRQKKIDYKRRKQEMEMEI